MYLGKLGKWMHKNRRGVHGQGLQLHSALKPQPKMMRCSRCRPLGRLGSDKEKFHWINLRKVLVLGGLSQNTSGSTCLQITGDIVLFNHAHPPFYILVCFWSNDEMFAKRFWGGFFKKIRDTASQTFRTCDSSAHARGLVQMESSWTRTDPLCTAQHADVARTNVACRNFWWCNSWVCIPSCSSLQDLLLPQERKQ